MNKQQQAQYSEKIRKRISRNMKRIRAESGWSQHQVATISGLAWHTIEKWEAGYNAPTVDKLMILCKATGWSLSDILGGAKKDAGA